MRQKIKYLLLTAYYPSVLYCLFKVVKMPTHSLDWWIPLLCLIVLALFFVASLIVSESGYKSTIFSPKLGKRIVHKSGSYYIRFDGDYYILYKDTVLFKYVLEKFDSSSILRTEDIVFKTNAHLDKLYAEEIKKLNKLKILQDWDGYTSADIRRDDKIKKII